MARNKGFSIVEVVIILAVVALIGLIGWRVWMANQPADKDTETVQVQDVQPINSDKDLDKVSDQLDEMNVEGTESQQLDSQTSF